MNAHELEELAKLADLREVYRRHLAAPGLNERQRALLESGAESASWLTRAAFAADDAHIPPDSLLLPDTFDLGPLPLIVACTATPTGDPDVMTVPTWAVVAAQAALAVAGVPWERLAEAMRGRA